MSLAQYTLHLADNALIYSQRLAEWCGHAPALEVDIAISNIALDHLGASRSLFQYASTLVSENATEDSLAFLRKEREYRNILLVEQANGDFGKTIARALYFDIYMQLFYTALSNSTDEMLAGIAQKSLKEVNYHLRFSSEWVIRLGDGTPESKQRMQTAIDDLWAYTGEMFTPNKIDTEMIEANIAPDITALHAPWLQKLEAVLDDATLLLPTGTWMHSGGKDGVHSEQMGFLLADLQYMQRAYPGAEW